MSYIGVHAWFHCVMIQRLVEEVRGMKEVKEPACEGTADTQCELQSGATWNLVRTTVHEWNDNPNDPPNEYEHDKKGKNIILQVVIMHQYGICALYCFN